MPKLSLKAMMAVVAFVAIGICGVRDPTPFWESIVFTVACLALVGGLLAVIGADPGRRRRWAGYCVVGWLYWLGYFGPSWVQGNVGPFLLTDHLVKEMTAEFRSPKLEAQMKSMQKAIQYYENDAMTAYAELEAIKRGGGMIQDDPALLKAEELAKAARRIVDFKSRHEVLLRSRGPWARYVPGVIRPEAFARVFHSLFAILAASAGWFVVGWMERRYRQTGRSQNRSVLLDPQPRKVPGEDVLGDG